jgi:hypothetical protein
VYCRINSEGVRAGDFSTNVKVLPADWHAKCQCIVADTEEAREDNTRLLAIRIEIKSIYNKLVREGKPITAGILKAYYLNDQAPAVTFLEAFSEMMDHLRKRAGCTVDNYQNKYNKTAANLWVNNGVPPETVVRMLEQSDVKTLMRF